MLEKYIFIIHPEEHTGRLDQTLAKLLPQYSRTQISAWIKAGQVKVDNNLAKAKLRLKGGEQVEIEVPPRPLLVCEAQAIPLDIVYEDEALIVINKPQGLIVHPGAGCKDFTLLNALLYHAPDLRALPRAGIVHRLDKDTTGLLVVAKTPHALRSLTSQLKKRTVLREYQAIVQGSIVSGGSIDAPIGRHPIQRKRMAVVETGKPALTHYRVLERFRAHTFLKLQLKTGRTHQIRVHLAHLHYPVVGDKTYGKRVLLPKGASLQLQTALRQMNRQALHARVLGFIHPDSGQYVQWESDLPEDMQQVLLALREDKNAYEHSLH